MSLSEHKTVDDLVTELQLSTKSNIVVEGKGDAIIYGELVDRLGIHDIDFVVAGCKSSLLKLYDKLSCYENKGDFRHAPVVFIADRDMWVFTDIPLRYKKKIIWTNGYSIENDLYSNAKLYEHVDYSDYDQLLTLISTWFAHKVVEYLRINPKELESIQDEESVSIALSCYEIIPKGKTTLADGLEFLPPTHEKVKAIKNEYYRLLRGKLLFELFARFLSSLRWMSTKAKINVEAVYYLAIKDPGANQLFSRLEGEVKKKLDKQEKKIKAHELT